MRHATRPVIRLVTHRVTIALVGLALTAGIVYTAETDAFTPSQRSFWSLQQVKKTPVPAVKNKQWARTPIDSFVLAKLEEAGLVTSKLELSSDGKALNYFEVADFAVELSPAAIVKAVKTLTAAKSDS